MPSPNIVDPVCPKDYTLQTNRMKYRLCKCIKNTDRKHEKPAKREYGNQDTYKKVKRRVTVKKSGRYNKCPTGTRYNKKTGYCEGRTKQSRSLMSALFKDDKPKEVKTKRKQYRNKLEKKRPKCPDGYEINHEIGLCQRKGSKKARKYMTKPRTYKAKTYQRKQPMGDSYYETVKPRTVRPQTVRPQTVRPQTVRPKTVRPKTVRPKTAFKPNLVKPRYNFNNSRFAQNKTQRKRVNFAQPAKTMVRKQTVQPEYISLGDYLERNKTTRRKTPGKKTYRKTPLKPILKNPIL